MKGISAFPRPFSFFPIGSTAEQEQTGMTLLDYFAGQALEGQFASQTESLAIALSSGDITYNEIARQCYGMAEAMLKEKRTREKR